MILLILIIIIIHGALVNTLSHFKDDIQGKQREAINIRKQNLNLLVKTVGKKGERIFPHCKCTLHQSNL